MSAYYGNLTVAGTGTGGTYYASTTTSGMTWISPTQSGMVTASAIDLGKNIRIGSNENDSLVLQTKKHKIDVDQMYELILAIAERFAIMSEDEELLAKYPTLRDAFDQYKTVEALMKAGEK